MTTEPEVTPVTEPEDEPTVAIDVLLLVHTPPDTVLDNVVELPTPTVEAPLIVPALTVALTVITLDVPHPDII
jgi:hypothetical protein